MPFVPRTPKPPITVNPRPRIRPTPLVSDEPRAPAPVTRAVAKPKAGAKKANREKIQPTGDHIEGYCRTPARTRFQMGNPGGPGRPRKDRKSQDDLMRDELLKSQHVTEGGRRRRKSLRELIPGLLVKATLQKLSPKELRFLQDEACRLFPERAPDAASISPTNPLIEVEYVRRMLAATRIGEPAGEGADPLADFVTSVFQADDEDDDDPRDDGDQDVGDEEATDEEA